jgi:16S rRNA (adenine(1408)-N(1))-methyltransferase
MTINFPWGSLLRGVLGRDDAVLAGISQLLEPGATATVLASVTERDGVPAPLSRQELAAVYARNGLELAELRPATPADIAAANSSWAKRSRAGNARPVTLQRLERPQA